MRKLKQITFLSFIFIITVAFNFKDNPLNGWYQQFLPNVSGQPISDITFLDSLNGFAITGNQTPNDTNYILKTTNGGDNWSIVYRAYRDFFRIKFINSNIGFICGGFNVINGTLLKTTNKGENWFSLNTPGSIWYDDMYVLNEDTIWLAQKSSLDGGVFRTTNGGVNWIQQFSMGTQNPSKIYFYNARIGFISREGGTPNIRKTTDGGATWTMILNGENFTDIHFIDSLNGWRSYGYSMKKTIDGGLNWLNQPMPSIAAGISEITKFSVINKDTIWGVGGLVQYPNLQIRGVIYTTTNGGSNWFYQVPDTAIRLPEYTNIQFINKLSGWAYSYYSGIHTKVGGDPLTAITQTNTQIPSQYILGQNYPNPFNPTTEINYEVKSAGFISIKVFDLQGREIAILINQKQNIGNYSVSFDASKYSISSGIYFYSMYANGNIINTRKMILVK